MCPKRRQVFRVGAQQNVREMKRANMPLQETNIADDTTCLLPPPESDATRRRHEFWHPFVTCWCWYFGVRGTNHRDLDAELCQCICLRMRIIGQSSRCNGRVIQQFHRFSDAMSGSEFTTALQNASGEKAWRATGAFSEANR